MTAKIIDITERIKEKKKIYTEFMVSEESAMVMDYAEELSMLTFNTVVTLLQEEGLIDKDFEFIMEVDDE